MNTLSIRNLIAICETFEGPLLSTTLSTALQDVFISCAFNNAVQTMPETLQYGEELVVFCRQGKGTMCDCPRVYARYGK